MPPLEPAVFECHSSLPFCSSTSPLDHIYPKNCLQNSSSANLVTPRRPPFPETDDDSEGNISDASSKGRQRVRDGEGSCEENLMMDEKVETGNTDFPLLEERSEKEKAGTQWKQPAVGSGSLDSRGRMKKILCGDFGNLLPCSVISVQSIVRRGLKPSLLIPSLHLTTSFMLLPAKYSSSVCLTSYRVH